MKKKVIYLFLGILILLVVMYQLFTVFLINLYQTNDSGQVRVEQNDIVKNSQDFLESGSDQAIIGSLVEYNVELQLYDLEGKIIYDSEDNGNIGQLEDINKILAYKGDYAQVYVINYVENKMNQQFDSLDMNKSKQVAIAMIKKNTPQLKFEKQEARIHIVIASLFACFLILLTIIFLMIYQNILRPFNKLEHLATEVAKGNLDSSLNYPRHNFFGAFTWSFDMLRNELKSSQVRADEAERTKKELVAILSHDIRTPIASIKAYAECLIEIKDNNSERSQRYVQVILQKTDELIKLSQDLFLHAISDLEKLEIKPKEYRSRALINSIIEPLILRYDNKIVITSVIPDVDVIVDSARLKQVYENILLNAAKYAPGSKLEIEATLKEDTLLCKFKDFGMGVLPEDLPFLFDKFYRGSNAKESGEVGSGLGLYICKYILEKMGGSIKAYNHSEEGNGGFVVEISLKIMTKR